MSKREERTIHAVQITWSLLDALQKMNGAGVTELADELGRSKSTIHNHLRTLEGLHLVVAENGQYRLSLRFLDIAGHVRDQFNNSEVIENELDSLAEETGEVAQFAIEEHGRISYLYKATGGEGVQTASSVGTQQDIHSTALGKSILSQLPESRVNEIIDRHGLPAKTGKTITDRAELFDELEQIRDRGYAVDDEENVAGLRCVAAPVTHDENVFGAVCVSAPSSRFSGETFTDEIPTIIKRSANVIELNSKFA